MPYFHDSQTHSRCHHVFAKNVQLFNALLSHNPWVSLLDAGGTGLRSLHALAICITFAISLYDSLSLHFSLSPSLSPSLLASRLRITVGKFAGLVPLSWICRTAVAQLLSLSLISRPTHRISALILHPLPFRGSLCNFFFLRLSFFFIHCRAYRPRAIIA